MTAQDTAQDAKADATPRHNRRKRASVGGFRTRLDAPDRKGFVQRWVNDEPGRMQEMHDLGYDFAARDTRTDGQGSRISRNVGTHPDGSPKLAYLMETPEKEYAIGVAEKEDRLKPFEEAIKRGDDTTGRLQDAYTPASGRSTINNSAG